MGVVRSGKVARDYLARFNLKMGRFRVAYLTNAPQNINLLSNLRTPLVPINLYMHQIAWKCHNPLPNLN